MFMLLTLHRICLFELCFILIHNFTFFLIFHIIIRITFRKLKLSANLVETIEKLLLSCFPTFISSKPWPYLSFKVQPNLPARCDNSIKSGFAQDNDNYI